MTPLSQNQLFFAALLAGSVAGSAAVFRLLSFSGALAAFAVGFFTFAFGGPVFTAALLAFFLSSSLLSRIGGARKKRAASGYEKGSTRDALQVLANGLIPSVIAIRFHLHQHERLSLMLSLAAFAAVNADTWATEIGGLSAGRPWLVTTLRRVDAGTSGAVSVLGSLAAALGALFIPMVAWLAWPLLTPDLSWWRIDAPEIIAIAWAGFLAHYADSLLGATVQAHYRCARCGTVSEKSSHCGAAARLARGWRWMTNDTVNLLTSACGLFFAWLLLHFFAYPK